MSDGVNTCSECEAKTHARGLCRRHYERLNYAEWAAKNPGKQAERVAKWRAANPERQKAIADTYYQTHKEKRNAESRVYRLENLERMRQLNRDWARNNPEKMRATNTARRAAKAQAIPAWADGEFETLFVKEAYDLAVRRTRLTGTPWHVDHIVPLRSRIVCGLHCAANLRVITGTENHTKGNRNWPDMPTGGHRASPRQEHDPRQSIQPHANEARPAFAVTRAKRATETLNRCVPTH